MHLPKFHSFYRNFAKSNAKYAYYVNNDEFDKNRFMTHGRENESINS